MRVLSENAVHRAFGIERSGWARWKRVKQNEGGTHMPSLMSAKNYAKFIPQKLVEDLESPVMYRMSAGAKPARGTRAELLPEICEVFLSARREGALHPSQEPLAQQAEILVTAFAKVGIFALIDEATGYQRDRTHDALRLLLAKYIAEGLQKWIKTFPDSFFAQLDRLYGNNTTHRTRPSYYGHFINTYIYNPLEHGYLKKELDKLNITSEGKRRARFHQWLKEDGRRLLTHQIGRVEGIMEACNSMEHFKSTIKKQKSISIAPYLFDEMNKIIA